MPGRAVQSHLVAAIEQLLLVGGVEACSRWAWQVVGCPGEVETETVTLRDRVQRISDSGAKTAVERADEKTTGTGGFCSGDPLGAGSDP